MATTSRRAEAKSKKARRSNGGLSKPCSCGRSNWDKAPCRDLHSWRLNFQCQPPGGVTTNFRVKLGRLSRAEAKRAAEEARVLLRKGEHPVQLKAAAEVEPAAGAPLTFEQVARRWLEQRPESTRPNDAARLNRLFEWRTPEGARLGDVPVGLVTEDTCEAYLRHLQAKGRAAATSNKTINLLAMVGRYAVRKGHRVTPFFDAARQERCSVLRRRKEAQRSRRLRPADEKLLLEVLEARNPRLHRLVVFLLETGCRLGEALSLTWADVDLDANVVRLRAQCTKTRTARAIPIGSARMARARFALEQGRLLPDGEVMRPEHHPFGDELGARVRCVKTAWLSALKAAAAKAEKAQAGSGAAFHDLHLHDLRHEAASRWAEAGLNINFISALLGHSNLTTTSRYINTKAPDIARALGQLDAALPAPAGSQKRSQSSRSKRIPAGNGGGAAPTEPLVM